MKEAIRAMRSRGVFYYSLAGVEQFVHRCKKLSGDCLELIFKQLKPGKRLTLCFSLNSRYKKSFIVEFIWNTTLLLCVRQSSVLLILSTDMPILPVWWHEPAVGRSTHHGCFPFAPAESLFQRNEGAFTETTNKTTASKNERPCDGPDSSALAYINTSI